MLTGILKKIEQYELSPVLFCDVTLRGNEETMRFGLYAAAPVLAENADGLELVFYTDTPKSLSHLVLAASYLGCSMTSCRETGEKQGFDTTYRLLFTKEKKAPEDALATLRLLLLCAYPHHQLCGLYKTVYKK